MDNSWNNSQASYSPKQVATMFGVKTVTVYAWLSRGELRGNKNGYRRVITTPQIQEFMSNRTNPEKVDLRYAKGPISAC